MKRRPAQAPPIYGLAEIDPDEAIRALPAVHFRGMECRLSGLTPANFTCETLKIGARTVEK